MSKEEEKKTVMVVEDDSLSMKLAVDLLEHNGFDVLKAVNGIQAIDILKQEKPDLILLDVMMLQLDGYEVCRKIKSEKDTQFIPIIMITSLNEREDKIKGIQAGCDDFISKPFDKNELLARVRSLLRIKSLHDELKYSFHKLKELEKMKNNLTHMIIHDLNNPLTTILGGLQFLEIVEGGFTGKKKEVLSIVTSACQDLVQMVSNLLDINKMEEGKFVLKHEKFHLLDVVKEVVEQMNIIALDKGKVLSLEESENMPDFVADKDLIKRVIANLINNALKFVKAGGIVRVRAFYKKEDDSFYVQVKDNGKGIPEKYLNRIFDKFIQVETRNVRQGRGLGLAFCKMVVEAHGGNIWAESKLENGSLFTFTLPQKR